jgi:predicted deacetylase
MSASFLVRFDDVCPTMNWDVWNQIEPILERHGVKPIVAVVPDNRDPALIIDAPQSDFWMRVRDWQARGWTIAVHGYQHAYVTHDPGIVGLNAFSEFAGLSYDEQRRKIENALAILAQEKVQPEMWIAPAHAFDATTVRILVEKGLWMISDGFYFRPVHKLGVTWIPQQLWRFRRLPAGLWTVCYHPNDFSEDQIKQFDRDLTRFRKDLLSISDVLTRYPAGAESYVDVLFSTFWLWKLQRRRLM